MRILQRLASRTTPEQIPSADLAYTAMTEGMDGLEDYYVTEGGIITVNTETAAALGIDYSVFNDMGTVVEVQTTED